MDVRPRDNIDGVVVADASRLPFRDNVFGFVFSSNVLEHVVDVDACLAELERVTVAEAIMIHTMPTPFWKLLQFGLNPVRILSRLVRPKTAAWEEAPPINDHSTAHAASEGGDARLTVAQRVRRAVIPPIHGVSKTQVEEMLHFRRHWWVRQFTKAGLTTFRTQPLFVHSPWRILPNRALGLRGFLGRRGLSSVRAYWVTKSG